MVLSYLILQHRRAVHQIRALQQVVREAAGGKEYRRIKGRRKVICETGEGAQIRMGAGLLPAENNGQANQVVVAQR